MAINPSLLIAAPILQDYLVDKDTGLPLAAGTITLYSETQRSIYKPWYTQQGTNPPYSYVPLPNPMTLSAVGTIQDADGNDVIPFFYPYKSDNVTFDSYYIVVEDSDGELQFTRSNFPFVANPNSTSPVSTNENLLVNNCFWRNVDSITLGPSNVTDTILINSTTYSYWTVAPSQHDGYIMPDINYFKNSTDGTEIVSFPKFVSNFADNILTGDITPEYYMNINCTSLGTATTRFIQIPLSLHIDSLSGFTPDSFTIQAMSEDDLNEVLTVGVFQFCGTGVTSPAVAVKTIVLSPTWNKYVINLPIPSAQGVTTGVGEDDALFIQISFPTTSTFNVNIALPSFYLSEEPATNSFQTYDQVNSIISSPRVGDTRTSLNSFSPYGWVPANDGTIGSPSSSATTRANADTWILYNLIWNSVNNTFAPVTGGRGANSYADFLANKSMSLTKALGRVLIGMPTSSTFSYNSSTGTLTVADATLYYYTSPVVLSNLSAPGLPFTEGFVYYVIPINSTSFALATTAANSLTRTAITGGTNGSTGTVSFSFGGTLGEPYHFQLPTEVGVHNHTGTLQTFTPGTPAVNTNLTYGTATPAGIASYATNNNLVSSNVAMNIIQPGTYINVFLKL